jgi:tetratricopeptide (TPR) repeat protein
MQSWYNKRRVFRFFGVLFLCSLTFSLWLGNVSWTSWQVQIGKVSNAQNSDTAKLVQIGIERYGAGDFKGSIEHLEKALNIYQESKSRDNEARVLEYLGRAYQEIGQPEKAISHWDKAIAYYRQVQNRLQLGRMLTEQAQAYYNIGHSRKAIALLCHKLEPKANPNCLAESAVEIASQQNDSLGKVAALGSLGEAYRLVGRYDEAITWLERAKEIAPQGYDFLVLNSLGNAYSRNLQSPRFRSILKFCSSIGTKSQTGFLMF